MGNCEGGKIIMSNGNVQRVREQFDKLYSGLNCRMFVFVFHYNLYILLFLLQFIFFKFILFYTGSLPPLTTTTGSSSTTGSMILIFIKNNLLKYLLIL